MFLPWIVDLLLLWWPFSVVLPAISLEARWWQGVAGIAQILAAILSMITILQARKVIAQAEEQRKLSVAPDWEVVEEASEGYVTGDNKRIARIALLNTGSGPARHPTRRFEPRNGNHPSIRHVIREAQGRRYSPSSVVPPNGLLTVRLTWYIGKPLDGLLTLTYDTRFGETKDATFSVRAWSDDQRKPHCQASRET